MLMWLWPNVTAQSRVPEVVPYPKGSLGTNAFQCIYKVWIQIVDSSFFSCSDKSSAEQPAKGKDVLLLAN